MNRRRETEERGREREENGAREGATRRENPQMERQTERRGLSLGLPDS